MLTSMEIPWENLSADVLEGIIKEFVLTEGTEYGEHEHTLDSKIEIVRKQIINGKAQIVFDPEQESCHIVVK